MSENKKSDAAQYSKESLSNCTLSKLADLQRIANEEYAKNNSVEDGDLWLSRCKRVSELTGFCPESFIDDAPFGSKPYTAQTS